MDPRAQPFPKSGQIFIFGFLSAIAPLSIDIYLPALPMLRQALAADEAQTLFTLSAFFIGFGGGQLLFGPLSIRPQAPSDYRLDCVCGRFNRMCIGREHVDDHILAIYPGTGWFGRAHRSTGDGARSVRSKSERQGFVPQYGGHSLGPDNSAADWWNGAPLV